MTFLVILNLCLHAFSQLFSCLVLRDGSVQCFYILSSQLTTAAVATFTAAALYNYSFKDISMFI